MANFHLNANIISRKEGRSSTAAAAYRAGEVIIDTRTGETHDYTRRRGVVHAEVVMPADSVWTPTRSELWNAVEKKNKRADSQVAREFVAALPSELDADRRRDLAVSFAHVIADRYGIAADIAIHRPSGKGDSRNHHAHILVSTNKVNGIGFGNKARELDLVAHNMGGKIGQANEIEWLRARWAEMENAALAEVGLDARVDHRSYKRQALAAGHDTAFAPLPTVHLGPHASAMERRGIRTAPGDLNREVKVFNLELERARREAKADAERPPEPILAPLMRLPESLLPANRTRKPEQRQTAPLLRLPTFPKAGQPAPNPSMEFARRFAERAPMSASAPKSKAWVGATTTPKLWTDAERQAWRRRLIEQHYQTEIEDSLAAALSFVDRQSVQDGLRLRLTGGGQLDDLGDQIQASGQDLRAECRATVALCKVKGWTAVESDGPPEYVAMMRQEAERAGLQFGSPGLPAANPDSEPDDDEPRHGLR